jgi:hypothetical protein
MNNTKTSAIVAVLVAATLVVGLTVATVAAANPAFAIAKKPPRHDGKKDNTRDGGNGNGNTVTVLKAQNKGFASGFDTSVNQEAENTICTHPSSNATCVSESEGAAAGGGGGGGGNIVCPDGFVRAFLILHLIPERILDGQICVSVSGQTSPVPPGGCTGGLVAVTIASSDLNVCARVL